MKKMEVTPDKLCKDMPKCFEEILTYAREIDFETEPDYEMIKQKLKKEMEGLKSRFLE